MSTSSVAGASSVPGNTPNAVPGGNGGGSAGGPCGACKFLRRKCVAGCIFAPYFDSEQGAAHFAAVHKVFGASNVSKLLLHIPVHKRVDAVVTICYEAQARLRDPIYGCVSHIFSLQQQVMNLQAEISYLQAHLASIEIPTPATVLPPAMLSDLSGCNFPTALFDHPPNTVFSRQSSEEGRHFPCAAASRTLPESTASFGDLQELARELLNRHSPATSLCCGNDDVCLPPAAPR